MKIKPVIEQYIYQKAGVQVGVKINYTTKEISLVEHNGRDKTWLFSGRGLGYMQGWQNILTVMKEAIAHAEKRLKDYRDGQLTDLAELIDEARSKK